MHGFINSGRIENNLVRGQPSCSRIIPSKALLNANYIRESQPGEQTNTANMEIVVVFSLGRENCTTRNCGFTKIFSLCIKSKT